VSSPDAPIGHRNRPVNASPLKTRLAEFLSLDNGYLFALAVAASVVPLWIPAYLPLVDIPQHASQVASLHQIWGGNPLFAATFEVNWFTPYLGGYLLLYVVSSVLSIVAATKLVVSAAVAAVPIVTGLLLREVGGDPRLRWLAIPGSYSFALYWGFMVYLVAVPVAIYFLVLTVRFERNPTGVRALGIAASSVVLFFCHVVALGFGSLIALTYIAARNFGAWRRLLFCALPYTTPLPLIVVWMSGIYQTEASVQNTPIVFAGLRERLITLFMQLSGLDGFAFLISLAVVGVFILVPLLLGYRFSKRPERWVPLAVGAVTYLIFPSYAQNTAFLYERLAVFLVPLWLIAWDPPSRPTRALAATVIVSTGLWLAINTSRFANFAEESRGFDTVLSKAEPGHRIAGMLLCNSSPYFTHPVYLHFAAWYQAVSAGVADMSFAITHPSMVRYRDMQAARFGEYLAWQPTEFTWQRDGGPDYDYFVVCAGTDASAALFKDRIDSVELVARDGAWWLYRNLDARPTVTAALESR
jgi:hypothetical protein